MTSVRAVRRRAIVTVLTMLAVAPGSAQQPTFPSRVDVVTVDVVVFDKQGRPVEGLTKDDFTIREDGRPQDIAAFDAVSLQQATAPPPSEPRIATNSEQPDAAARWFFLVFDDANITPQSTVRARTVMTQFIDKVLRPGDHVMIAAASGAATWTGELPRDREDLDAFVQRLRGEHTVESGPARMWDHEAIGIALGRDPQALAQVLRRYYENDVLMDAAIPSNNINAGLGVDPGTAFVQAKARLTYTQARSRLQLSLGRLERVSEALAEARGRKTLLMFSEGFIMDQSLGNFRTLIQAARNANVAIHFVDVSDPSGAVGQEGVAGSSAEVGRAILDQDATTSLALAQRESDGARSIAAQTGGTTISGTNLLAGLARVVQESRAYYLIGYTPKNTKRDGKFRQIQVTVNRPNVEVRARGGYYAPAAKETVVAPPSPDKLDPAVRAGLDSPFSAPGLPMRMASYVEEPRADGKVRTLLVAEADLAPLRLEQFLGSYSAKLDSYVLLHDRDRDDVQRDEKLIEISLPPAVYQDALRAGLPIQREFFLSPGHYQATLLLQDRRTGLVGSVRQEFDVPPPGQFHMSTPVISDGLQPGLVGGAARVLPIAHRTFKAGTRVFVQFDVLGAMKPAAGVPRATLTYALARADGTPVITGQPQPLRPNAGGQFTAIVGMTLPRNETGDHRLRITIRDEVAGKTIETDEPLTIIR